MEWIQVFTIIATVIGGAYYFRSLTKEEIREIREEIKVMRDEIKIMKEHHREDMREMRQGFSKVYELWSDLLRKISDKKTR